MVTMNDLFQIPLNEIASCQNNENATLIYLILRTPTSYCRLFMLVFPETTSRTITTCDTSSVLLKLTLLIGITNANKIHDT